MEETKVIYHIDDEETPYLVKIAISPDKVTLADFKNVLNRPNYKFFFKSMDDDFGYIFHIIFLKFHSNMACYSDIKIECFLLLKQISRYICQRIDIVLKEAITLLEVNTS